MIKALEALCYLDDIANGRKMSLDPHKLKLIVEKELKALEIIKNKRVCVRLIYHTNNAVEYNEKTRQYYDCMPLTKEEYELLREVLK